MRGISLKGLKNMGPAPYPKLEEFEHRTLIEACF